jgi:cytochrome c oxidase subunit II
MGPARRALIMSAAAAASTLLGGCSGPQSALDAAGVQAEHLQSLWWTFFAVTAAVYVIVMIVLLIALVRRKVSSANEEPDRKPEGPRENRVGNIVKGAVAVMVVTLFILMITSFRAGKAIDSLSSSPPKVVIKVTGHQWWWEIRYEDEANPSNDVSTANEIHVPLGTPVMVKLESADVIHSLWMPNMHGKRDLIPIHPTTIYFEADKPGIYWGQCAEFCGFQHAKMRFSVVAETREEFDSWLNAQRTAPSSPADTVAARGLELFKTGVCAQCHTVQGTSNGRVGPDLTHVASRPYIAAGSYQNTREHLAQWISDPQAIKPGIQMPMNQYSDEDLNSLVTYIESLK